jgi:deoxynucleoside triphosphate triphosphohydrolase SAMHD1
MRSGESASHVAPSVLTDLADLASQWIEPQIQRLTSGTVVAAPKVFNDNVWGTVRLHGWEVAVLNTRLMQRLREIRQLGVIHWVYQSAGHSRFEHSLGVLHQMQGLLDGVERNSARAGHPVVDEYTTYVLRLAALLHDAGHAAMSHVSDPILAEFADAKPLLAWTKREYNTKTPPSVTESVAAAFVTSPAFRKLLSLREVGADFIRDVNETTRHIASLIVGGSIRSGSAFQTLLVNGAFDADKLDYMQRDCLMAGVPSAVDVDRMVEKVQVLEVPAELLAQKYPSYFGWTQEEHTGTVRVLCLSAAGKGALHELAATRTVLFRKVYHHQKVRALELMVRRVMREIRAEQKITSAVGWLGLVDSDILQHKGKTATQLRERYLLKRAFHITAPLAAKRKEQVRIDGELRTRQSGWLQLRRDFADGVLRTKIVAEALHAAEILQKGADALQELEPDVDLVDRTKYSLDQFAFVGDGINDFNASDTVEGGERSEGTKRLSDIEGQVYAPEKAILPVFFAAWLVLSRDYGISPNEYCHTITKVDPEQIQADTARLEAAGYFADLDTAPRITPSRITTHRAAALESFLKAAWPRIQKVAVEFGRYVSVEADPISPARVAEFLRQFPDQSLARPALRLLESIQLRGRRYLMEALSSRLAYARKEGGVACVVPLGATGDSSTLLSYLMNDLPVGEQADVLSLEMALQRHSGKRIMLWDDFCGSGRHTKTVLAQWLGLPDDSDEDLVSPLPDELSHKFRSQPIGLTFAAGMTAGADFVRRFCEEHGLENLATWPPYEPIAAVDAVFDDPIVIPDPGERHDLKEFLENTARRIYEPRMTRDAKPWTREKIESRLLGFDNACQRIVFFYNVPTVTITALWEQGEGSMQWRPLFRRRTKPSRPQTARSLQEAQRIHEQEDQ